MSTNYHRRRQAEAAVLRALAGLALYRREDTLEVVIVTGGTHSLEDVLEAERVRRTLETELAASDQAERELDAFEQAVLAGRGDR